MLGINCHASVSDGRVKLQGIQSDIVQNCTLCRVNSLQRIQGGLAVKELLSCRKLHVAGLDRRDARHTRTRICCGYGSRTFYPTACCRRCARDTCRSGPVSARVASCSSTCSTLQSSACMHAIGVHTTIYTDNPPACYYQAQTNCW